MHPAIGPDPTYASASDATFPMSAGWLAARSFGWGAWIGLSSGGLAGSVLWVVGGGRWEDLGPVVLIATVVGGLVAIVPAAIGTSAVLIMSVAAVDPAAFRRGLGWVLAAEATVVVLVGVVYVGYASDVTGASDAGPLLFTSVPALGLFAMWRAHRSLGRWPTPPPPALRGPSPRSYW